MAMQMFEIAGHPNEPWVQDFKEVEPQDGYRCLEPTGVRFGEGLRPRIYRLDGTTEEL